MFGSGRCPVILSAHHAHNFIAAWVMVGSGIAVHGIAVHGIALHGRAKCRPRPGPIPVCTSASIFSGRGQAPVVPATSSARGRCVIRRLPAVSPTSPAIPTCIGRPVIESWPRVSWSLAGVICRAPRVLVVAPHVISGGRVARSNLPARVVFYHSWRVLRLNRPAVIARVPGVVPRVPGIPVPRIS